MVEKLILDEKRLVLTLKRLAQQIVEQHRDMNQLVIIGIQPRGVWMANRIIQLIQVEHPSFQPKLGKLDISFYRDDVRQDASIKSYPTDIQFSIADKKVLLIDDVLYTGRTIRAALDALLAFGRPAKVELMVLIDRKFSRDLPIHADYIGQAVDTFNQQKVKVKWKEKDGEDAVIAVEN
jgi:pyrimidine operon attenuation protein/uracil phosphoribosyltransferase